MSDYKRAFEVQRDSVNVKAGTFDAVLFTGGEATDGHRLNIRGGTLPESMPLFVNHLADPRTQLGTLRELSRNANEIVVRGQILTEGEGPEAEIRRDMLLKMSHGMVRSMSGRWDADESNVTRRSSLEKDHPAFVSDKDTGPKRHGLLFEKWQAMEGSIVGLGADPGAVMRAAEDEDSSEAVRAFWRGQLLPEEQGPDKDAVLASFAAQCRELLAGDVTPEELIDALATVDVPDPERDAPEMIPSGPVLELLEEIRDRICVLEEAQAHERVGSGSDDPSGRTPVEEGAATPTPLDPERVATLLGERVVKTFDGFESRVLGQCNALIDKARGRVTR